jgi:ATP-dependent Lhr-like helicase
VFERQGRLLRVFDESALKDALSAFARDFKARRVFPAQNRVTVKAYPDGAAGALSHAGFMREMRDFVLYR